MAENSKIQWTHHTFNPVWGCTRISKGCVHCYAETFARRTGVGWGPSAERRIFGDKHWAEPLKWNREAAALGVRHRVFCGSMCDIFEDHPVTEAQLPRLMKLIEATPHLDWLLLTKRPERAAAYLRDFVDQREAEWTGADSGEPKYKPRWWLGTSVEDQESADLRIPFALKAPAAVRYISYEPALGPVDFRWALSRNPLDIGAGFLMRGHFSPGLETLRPLDWIIVGGESGHGARPFDIEWALSTIEQCHAAGAAVFVKQIGTHPHSFTEAGRPLCRAARSCGNGDWRASAILIDRKGGNMDEWDPALRVREFPEVSA